VIIQILCNIIEDGYQRNERDAWISPFFAGANVAFRRKALNQVGPYDEKCTTGEDRDICLRMADAGWEIYFEPRARVGHKNRLTPRSLVRQWFGYGFHHPYVAAKHSSPGLRVYRPVLGRGTSAIYRSLFSTRFPVHVSVFLTPFLTMHLLAILAVILAVLGQYVAAAVFGGITLAVALGYFRSDIRRRNILQAATFVVLRYLANLALLAGGLLGGAKLGMLYIGATFDYKR
jgi:cellulose synthase/poly-beta-1,6-N-acetylglucosamine synthase-like glycosyltransferase